jgi:hypothetical protein
MGVILISFLSLCLNFGAMNMHYLDKIVGDCFHKQLILYSTCARYREAYTMTEETAPSGLSIWTGGRTDKGLIWKAEK